MNFAALDFFQVQTGRKRLKSCLPILAMTIAAASAHAHDIGHEHTHVEGGWNAKAGFVSDTDITARLWNPRGKSREEIIQP